jgi:hypothetical protein
MLNLHFFGEEVLWVDSLGANSLGFQGMQRYERKVKYISDS